MNLEPSEMELRGWSKPRSRGDEPRFKVGTGSGRNKTPLTRG